MEDDIQFVTQQCGIKISHSKWNKRHHITVKGEADNKVNIRDRLTHLRLWSDPQHKPVDVNVLDIWDSVYLPDVKVPAEQFFFYWILLFMALALWTHKQILLT